MHNVRVILVEEGEARRPVLEPFLKKIGVRVEFRQALADASWPGAGESGLAIVVLVAENARDPLFGGLGPLRQARPHLPVIALVPSHASADMLPFVEHGLIDHVTAPENLTGLYSAVRSEGLKAELVRRAEACLKDIVRLNTERAASVRRALAMEEMYETTLENFMTALDLRDVETFGHSKTVARYSHVLAEALGIREPKTLENIRKGALLHDAGKIAIPDSILKKPGPLTEQEWEKVRRHPALGYGLIKDIKLVKEVGNIILCHHERYDGAGYPRGLKGSDIPLEARIFAVADTLDAVTSHRPYRSEREFGTAKEEIIRNAGTQFDPAVVDAFCGLDLAVWEKIRFETTRIMPGTAAYRHLAEKS
jgi:putative nucleotidyltransferase with HDIG domain